MTVGVYGIFCIHTNRCLYVGQSRNIEYRWKKHRQTLLSGTHKRKGLVEWVNRFGIESIYFTELELCKENELNSAEIYWFNKLLPEFFGKQPSNKDKWDQSDETKRKISKSLKQHYINNPRPYKDPIEDKARRNKIKCVGVCKFCGSLFPYSSKKKVYCSHLCVVQDVQHSDNFRARIREMYESGMSLREIARAENKSHIAIRRRLLLDKVSLRTNK